MKSAEVARLEALRSAIDADLAAVTDESEQLEELRQQLDRRRQRLEQQWRRLISERDRTDERLWNLLTEAGTPAAEISDDRSSRHLGWIDQLFSA